MNDKENNAGVRLDKWLWAARFFKTRSLAAQAVSGGKVHLNSQRAKPAREIRIGDELSIRRGEVEWSVVVRRLSRKRGPASEAALLYEETEESQQNRQAMAAQINAWKLSQPHSKGRPSKKSRRQIARFTRGRG